MVEKAIDNQESQLKEYVIATEFFGRKENYNPRIDSTVRVQAGRLRTKLTEYYSTEGKADRVLIDLPKGHYTPVFSYAQIRPANGKRAETDTVPEQLTLKPDGQHPDLSVAPLPQLRHQVPERRNFIMAMHCIRQNRRDGK